MRRTPARGWLALLLPAIVVFVAACEEPAPDPEDVAAGCDGEITQDEIEIWWHENIEAEIEAIETFVDDFNASQDEVTATLTLVPEEDYHLELLNAAAAGNLPDVIDADASYAFQYAWTENIQPIDTCINDELLDELLPSVVEQGTYADRLWGLGMFDSGLGMFAYGPALEEVGARIPAHPDEAWTIDEFSDILADLRAAGWEQPLDVKLNYGLDEFFSYAYQPFVWSAGADIISPDFDTTDGYLNSDEAVEALSHPQDWMEQGYIHPNEDDAAFVDGEAAVSLVGHWEYTRYDEALGDDLVLAPLPDFGEGTRSAQGSWQWTVNAESDADAAWSFIEFTLQPEQQEHLAATTDPVPARTEVADASERWGPGGDLELLRVQLEEGYTVPRPPHPAYPRISEAFNEAIRDIYDGIDVREALEVAVEEIDADLEANEGYPPPELED